MLFRSAPEREKTILSVGRLEAQKDFVKVKQATGGDAEQMAQLFGSVEGLNSILVLTGKGAGDFDKVMNQMAQSAGMTREAYEKMLTPSEQMQIAMNQMKNAGMDLAVSFTPYFKAMSLRVKELAAWFRSLTPEQKTLIGQVAFGIVTFQLFGSTLGRVLTIGGRAFGTFNSIATGISMPLRFVGCVCTPNSFGSEKP